MTPRKPRLSAWLLAGALGVGAGCSHTKAASDTPASASEDGDKDKDGKKKDGKDKDKDEEGAGHRTARGDGSPSHHEPRRRERETEDLPIATSAAGLLAPGAERKLQDKLAERGLLEGGGRSGQLDARTQTALRRFQRDADLPETGLPDQETVRKLGLNPDDIFRRAESKQDGDKRADDKRGEDKREDGPKGKRGDK